MLGGVPDFLTNQRKNVYVMNLCFILLTLREHTRTHAHTHTHKKAVCSHSLCPQPLTSLCHITARTGTFYWRRSAFFRHSAATSTPTAPCTRMCLTLTNTAATQNSLPAGVSSVCHNPVNAVQKRDVCASAWSRTAFF